MNWAPFAWIAGGLLLLLILRQVVRSRTSTRASYVRRDFLLSMEERQFFQSLRQAVGDEYVIFGKIRIADLIAPRSGAHKDVLWQALEELGEAHFPFVLCKASDLSIACAIQLVRRSPPGRKDRKPQDYPLKTICATAGLPLLRLEAGPFYDRHDIRQAVAEAVRKEPLFIGEPDGRKEPTLN